MVDMRILEAEVGREAWALHKIPTGAMYTVTGDNSCVRADVT